MNVVNWIPETLRRDALSALVIACISGLSGAAFVLMLIHAGHNIVDGVHYERYWIILPLIASIFIAAKRVSHTRITKVVEHSLKQQILGIANFIRQTELLSLEKKSPTEIYLTMTDARIVAQSATRSVMIVRCLTTILVCWLYMFTISVGGGAIFGLMLLVMYGVTMVYEKRYAQLSDRKHAQEEAMFQIFHHLLDGYKELVVNRQKNDDLFHTYLTPSIHRAADLSFIGSTYYAHIGIFRDTVYYIVLGCVVFLLPKIHSSPVVLSLLTILLYLWPLVITLFNEIPVFAEGTAAMERLSELADDLKPATPIRKQVYIPLKKRITDFQTMRAEEIQFAYTMPDGTTDFAIGPLNLTITAGEILFLSGGNGSGKTTLLKVLTGLYPPTSGVLSLNDAPVQMRDHRYLFTSVFHDFHLFDSLYGLETIDDRQVNTLLLQMELLNTTQWKRQRFSSLNLSTGQKRRLALVTALMEAKPIYIFDEWAADQAPLFRQYFYETLLPELQQQGKTILAVTHDDHYYHCADRVIRMEDGRIVQDGKAQQ